MHAFYLRPILTFSYCGCLNPCVYECVCVCVCAFVCQSWHCLHVSCSNLNPQNSEKCCKTPWLRSILLWYCWEGLTLTFKVRFDFKVKILLCLFGYWGKYPITGVSTYQPPSCFTVPPFAHTYLPRSLQGPDWFTVSIPCILHVYWSRQLWVFWNLPSSLLIWCRDNVSLHLHYLFLQR